LRPVKFFGPVFSNSADSFSSTTRTGPDRQADLESEHAPPERIYRGSVRVFSLVFCALGLVLIASTLARGGGPLALGVLLGAAFLAVGLGRLWIASRV
jgi:hypothetical protein